MLKGINGSALSNSSSAEVMLAAFPVTKIVEQAAEHLCLEHAWVMSQEQVAASDFGAP